MIVDLFKVPVYDASLDLDNKILEQFCIELSKKDRGRQKSNSGGWQSNDLQQDSRLDPLVSEISYHSNSFFRELGLVMEAGMTNIWANVNKYGDFNREHLHPSSKISGVYYVKVPEKSGNFVFLHPCYDIMGYDWHYEGTPGSDYVTPAKKLHPTPGTLILFPSWLKHFVEPNMNLTERRISISFNLA